MRTIAIWTGMLAVLATAGVAEAKIVEQTVVLVHEGKALECYLTYDDELEGPLPGVLVVHQWMGLTANERMRANMLAKLGYVALATDVYGRNIRPQNQEAAAQQAGRFYQDRELFRGRLQAGLEELKKNPRVDPDRVAAIGYCFGGAGVLELARSGADLAGVVSFHGNLDTPLPVQPGELKAKILVCHGAADPYVKREAVFGFVDEMEAVGADYQLIMYSGAVHAFTQKAAGDDPSKGAAYDADADRRSWQAMQDFLDEIFR